MIPALELYRSLPRYAAARTVGRRAPGLLAGPLAPLRHVHRPEPQPGRPGWARVRPRLAGICGSDLTTLSGEASRYFSALVSMPFVPGHEVVGDLLDDAGELPAGSRVVLDPVLGCVARGVTPCPACACGQRQRCDSITAGHLAPGLQTGYCRDTGGGWSGMLLAHASQLHPVPDTLTDEHAVLAEPLACALHVAERARVRSGDTVLVIGAGAVGLLTVLALRATTPAARVLCVAKHPRQRELAGRFGAHEVLAPGDVVSGVRRATRAVRLDPERCPPALLGGVDVAIEAAGNRTALDTALRCTRAGGRVVLAGMPPAGADLSPAWLRELDVRGAYAGGPPTTPGGAFGTALDLLAAEAEGHLVSATYPLTRWREALDHAMDAGRLGTVKVAFDLRGRS